MTYTIELDEVSEMYANLTEARESADKTALEQHREVVVVHTESGIVAHVATWVPADSLFKPWERVENVKHPAPNIKGYVTAYSRKRIQATAFRPLTKGNPWLIHDGRTGGLEEVAGTEEGRKLFTRMKLGYRIPAEESEPVDA